jgi:arginyl-tRNA synthetase
MTEYAKGLKHYSYELVELRGRTMSGRLAQYVTADEYYDETYIRARMAKRQADAERNVGLPTTKTEWKIENETLRAVTLASTRFPLVETAPNKRIELDLDRELDFRRNAGPFVEYAHARCASLMTKVKQDMGLEANLDIDYTLLAHDDIVAIIQHLKSLPDTIRKAADQQDPSQIANWCISLAQSFMKFYENYAILRAETEQLAQARLTMVEAIRRGLFTGLEILGIPAANQL